MTGAPLPLWWEERLPSAPAGRPHDGSGDPGDPGNAGDPGASTILLLPDAQRNAASWPEALLDDLTVYGLRIVLVDLRDQGRSPWPAADRPYSIEDVAADIVPLLRTLVVARDAAESKGLARKPPILLGHGFGVSVALELAQRCPELVGGLVAVGGTGWFVDPGLPGPEEPVAVGLIWRARLAAASDRQTNGVPAEGSAERRSLVGAMARELRLLAGPDDDPRREAARSEVERWLAWGFNLGDRQRGAWLAAPPRWSVAAARRHPLAVVHGADDPLVPLAHGRRLAAEAGVAVEVVDGAGHELSPPLARAVAATVVTMATSMAHRP